MRRHDCTPLVTAKTCSWKELKAKETHFSMVMRMSGLLKLL